MRNREKLFQDCSLCPRACHVNRLQGKRGYCGMDADLSVARAALHLWEEPCISGQKGSGTVFFTGCSLRCCFCQNHEIASGMTGKKITVSRLAEIFLEMQDQGAANINLVTACHFIPQILDALDIAHREGLVLPIVYNSGGYEKVESLKLLEGYVDIYLPDLKYLHRDLAGRFSHAPDYPEIVKAAITEMVRQTGPCEFDADGYMQKGTIVRHLILPGHTRNSKAVLNYLKETFGDEIYISIMNQFTPACRQETFPELNRKVTKREYEKVLKEALCLQIGQAYIQEGDTARESFIPPFDLEGV
ncbi:MAG: radical SAM protein [Blautia sp.]|nr:radical SAM protein [Blautia sp.]